MSDAVILRGMRFHALVGILPHEREVAQPLEVDLTAWLTTDIAVGASATTVVDYRTLYDLVAAQVTREQIDYIEELAATIADHVLADRRITRVEIAVRKPHVALPGPLAAAEVRVDRTRRE